MSRPRILIVTSRGLPSEWVDEIKERASGADITTAADNEAEIKSAAPGANALINCPRHMFSAEIIERAGDGLRWIHLGGAGCEEYMIPELVESNIVLTTGKIIQGPEVADHAIALLLMLTRNLHLVLRGTTEAMPRPIELRRKTLVIVGLGGIGLLVAERAHVFGMRVIGVDAQYIPMLSALDKVYPPERLGEVLSLADAVIMAAPRTDRSHRLMGRAEFAAMKSTAYYVAVSRGATADTAALTAALAAGQIGGAALDVTDPEPLPDDHPLRHMDNVVITPHIAGLSDHNRQRSLELIKANVERFVAGAPLYNIVDKALGY